MQEQSHGINKTLNAFFRNQAAHKKNDWLGRFSAGS